MVSNRLPRWLAAGLLIGTVGAGYLSVTSHDDVELELYRPGESAAPVGFDKTSSAAELLEGFEQVLLDPLRPHAVPLAARDPAARRSLIAVLDNVRELGIRDVDLRYVDEAGRHRSPALAPAATTGTRWTAHVAVTWRLPGDRHLLQGDVRFTFEGDGEGARIAGIGAAESRAAPLWLLDTVGSERSRRALVISARGTDPHHYLVLAEQAAADVRRLLPGWRGRLVVQVPASAEHLEQMTGVEEGTHDAIAALATSMGGSDRDGPAHVLVNPEVFESLGDDAQHIVMAHEATHVATNAATSSMPLWLAEGFADYVALAGTDLPVSVLASQVIAEVHDDGPPRSLPGSAAFDPGRARLSASYESAWLACRLLAARHGEDKLVAFYRAVDRAGAASVAFRRVLGTTQRAFTQDWRRYLRRLSH